MAIADSKALLADIMNVVDDHVTAKASKLLEKQIMDILDGYQIATMIRNDSGDADNSYQLIDAFINAKTAEGLAKRSITLYRRRLKRLYEDTGIPIKKMNADHLKSYIANEIDRGLAKATVNGFERTVWQFFKWLHEEGLIPKNPTRNIKVVKALYEQREAFTGTEIELIKEAYADGLTDAYSLICQAPAADVVERKTWKWMLPNNEVAVYLNEWICSACNYLIDGKHNFCPNCGAQMIGGDDDV